MDFWVSVVVGGAVGAGVAGVMVYQLIRVRKKIVGALAMGDMALARRLIDKRWPRQTKLGNTRILALTTRFTALGALGETQTVRDEVAALKGGGLSAKVQVNLHALLVRRLLDDPDPEVLPRMRELVEEIERDGGAMLGMVKRQARAYLGLALAMDGEPMNDEARKTAESMARQADHLRPVLQLALMHERLARNEREGMAGFEALIERDWPHSEWSRRAAALLAQAES